MQAANDMLVCASGELRAWFTAGPHTRCCSTLCPLPSPSLLPVSTPAPAAVCQTLRIISFTSTQLPGPSPHCHEGAPTSVREWPAHWWGHLVVDVDRQVTMSCGDLIFSSHMTFVLAGAQGDETPPPPLQGSSRLCGWSRRALSRMCVHGDMEDSWALCWP